MSKIILFLMLFITHSFAFSYEVKIPVKVLQNEIQKKFPYTRKDFLITTTIQDAKIELKEKSDRVYIDADIKLVLMGGYESSGKTTLNSTVEYKKEEKSLFLNDIKIEKIDMSNIRPSYKDMVKEIVESIVNIVLKQEALYKVETKDSLENKALEYLEKITIEEQQIVLHFKL